MTCAYYNENDTKAAAWLRELIKAGHITPGEVDERSIANVHPNDLVRFTQCHFFAGIGGWSLALRLAGWPDNKPVWTGSCPCQPFSVAGKGLGEADERHLWPEFKRLIAERNPATVFGEQVASAAGRLWLAGVFADLEALAYAVGAADLCAASISAPHIRQRLFWVANAEHAKRRREQQPREQAEDCRPGFGRSGGLVLANGSGRNEGESSTEASRYRDTIKPASRSCWMGSPIQQRLEGQSGNGDNGNESGRFDQEPDRPVAEAGRFSNWSSFDILHFTDGKTRRIESGTFPLAHGVSGRVGLLRGYGNAIVPQLAAEFIQAYQETLT